MDADQCPTKDQLISWAQDEIRPAVAWSLQLHIAGCKECQSQLLRLGLRDSLSRLEGNETVAATVRPSVTNRGTRTSEAEDDACEFRDNTADERRLVVDTSFLHESNQPDTLGKIGRFHVQQVLGAGGMGIVLQARDPELDRTVAVKVLKPVLAQDAGASSRFV